MLEPCIALDQYKTFGQNKLTGFINWAYLSEPMKFKFTKFGIIDNCNWKSGDNLCFVHLVCNSNLRDIINWAKKHFGTDMKYDKEVSWIRINEEIKKTMRITNKWVQ